MKIIGLWKHLKLTTNMKNIFHPQWKYLKCLILFLFITNSVDANHIDENDIQMINSKELKYSLIYIFSIYDCWSCQESINQQLNCIIASDFGIDICGYILAERKVEQQNFVKSRNWKHCLYDKIKNVRKDLKLKNNTMYVLTDKNGKVIIEIDADLARKSSVCNIIKTIFTNPNFLKKKK